MDAADCNRAHTNARIRSAHSLLRAQEGLACKALHVERFPFMRFGDSSRSRKLTPNVREDICKNNWMPFKRGERLRVKTEPWRLLRKVPRRGKLWGGILGRAGVIYGASPDLTACPACGSKISNHRKIRDLINDTGALAFGVHELLSRQQLFNSKGGEEKVDLPEIPGAIRPCSRCKSRGWETHARR